MSDTIQPGGARTCRRCLFWMQYDDGHSALLAGLCESPAVEKTCDTTWPDRAGALVPSDGMTGDGLITGPDFGCRAFEPGCGPVPTHAYPL